MKEQTRTIKPLVISFGIGLLASLLILLAAAWLISSGHSTNMQIFAIAAIFAGSLISALGTVAYFKQRQLIVGVTASLSFFLLVFLLGAIVYFRAVPAAPVVGMLITSLVAGCIAGVIPRKSKRKKRG
jgi:putative membrane protein (TIGR04086 family)